jgi:hypothetical protein
MSISAYNVQIHYLCSVLRHFEAWRIDDEENCVQQPKTEELVNHNIPSVVSQTAQNSYASYLAGEDVTDLKPEPYSG